MNLFSFLRGAMPLGMVGLALGVVVLLCGAGSVPVENFLPQGTMQGDLNAGGHNLTNVGTMNAASVVASGTLTAGSLKVNSQQVIGSDGALYYEDGATTLTTQSGDGDELT